MDDQIKAVIDADFFRHTTEYDRSTDFFMHIMSDLSMQPVMHEFVAGTELRLNPYLEELLQNHKITVIHYKDYLLDDLDKEEYKDYFFDAFDRINHYDFPDNEDIYMYSEKQESLGEIRSFYMAMKKGYRYFMSDDGDSRILAKNFFSNKHAVEVDTLYDVLVRCKEEGTDLRWKDINPAVSNAMNKRQDKIEKLKTLYTAGGRR